MCKGVSPYTVAAILIGFTTALLTCLFHYLESSSSTCSTQILRMAENIDENRASFKEKNQSAFIVGYTGETGKELVKETVKSGIFSKVVLIGRREVKYDDEEIKNLEQKIVDFDKLEDSADVFQGFDIGFCCLGTTRGKAGKEGFIKVDHDYVMNTAKLAKAGGCKHFQLVSSQGANKNSMFLYPKVKGEVEAELGDLGFERLSIFRPAMLMCNREESRPMESVARFLMKPIAAAFPTAITTPTSFVATAMVNCAANPTAENVTIYDNKAIFQLAGQMKSKK